MIGGLRSSRAVPGPALVAAVLAVTFGLGVPAHAAGGDLDPSFGTGGKATTTFPGGSYANAVAIQNDGTIVAVGATAGSSGTGEFAAARYETDGTLDQTFGEDGMVNTPIAGGSGDEARSVAIQADGKIVVAGTDSEQRFALVRYLGDGTLDPSFGGNGVVRTNLTSGLDIGYDVAVQTNGKIVVAGVAGGPFSPYFAVLRYRHDGSIDPTFADAGRAILIRDGTARSLVIQPDGRIVVTGYTPWGLTVARLLRDGRLDRSFGGDGVVGRLTGSDAYLIWPLVVDLQANGKIVVAGDYDIFRSGIARFTTHGRLDRTFGNGGVVSVSLGPNEQAFAGLAIQTNGRIVAAGHVEPHEFGDTTVPRIVVARFLRDGSLDDTWGGNGKVTTRFPGGSGCEGVELQADGKIVVAGEELDPLSFALVRYLP